MAQYAIISGGGGSVFQNTTGKTIPEDVNNKDWAAYLVWLAVPNVPDAETQSLAELRAAVVSQVHAEAEDELGDFRGDDQAGALTSLDFENIRREAVAADTEGTPWATGYPFLEEQVGIRGADVGIVATYWLGEWSTYEDGAKLIEAAREQFLVDLAAAGTFSAVRAIRDAIMWPNKPEPTALAVVLTAPDVTLSGPFADIDITPDPAASPALVATPSVFVPIHPDPAAASLVAPALTISIA